MKKLLTFALILLSASAASAQKSEESGWEYRISTKPLHFLAGIPNAEIEFSPGGKWTNSIGLYSFDLGDNTHDDLFDYDLTGVVVRWNYYAMKNTSVNSWVWGVGFNVYYGNRHKDSSRADVWAVAPELTGAYQWNFNPVSLKLGLGVGIASAGLIFDLGYAF